MIYLISQNRFGVKSKNQRRRNFALKRRFNDIILDVSVLTQSLMFDSHERILYRIDSSECILCFGSRRCRWGAIRRHTTESRVLDQHCAFSAMNFMCMEHLAKISCRKSLSALSAHCATLTNLIVTRGLYLSLRAQRSNLYSTRDRNKS